ncbi:hypothetical protein [Clostridium pasteurianum]|uniref:Uncharacterized protein n=1 Tax=Clostridium pasteurianum BC1 TaxID=86416 RepID=R4K1G4_CLOPA|nr:hypothetical protein [Clostridium pasteurianum]AGK96408.1 hypothetical protein Clopa_1433 [Clostridium pasteurianum BC1]
MKIELKKKLPITIALIITSLLTIIFAALSITYGNSFTFRVLTQGSVAITMFLSGINSLIYQKQKLIALFSFLVSGFLIFVMITTIHVGLLKNAF